VVFFNVSYHEDTVSGQINHSTAPYAQLSSVAFGVFAYFSSRDSVSMANA
jgi:hypothetical protein